MIDFETLTKELNIKVDIDEQISFIQQSLANLKTFTKNSKKEAIFGMTLMIATCISLVGCYMFNSYLGVVISIVTIFINWKTYNNAIKKYLRYEETRKFNEDLLSELIAQKESKENLKK